MINVDSAEYIKSAEEWRPLPNSIEAIALLCKKGYRIFVATNQAGLARGLFTETELDAMHEKLTNLVIKSGGEIDAIFYCPHHPDANCDCRKPKPGLLNQVEAFTGESLTNQPFVGDSRKDIDAAIAIGARPVLVRTGNGLSTESQLIDESIKVDVYDDLYEFANLVPKLES